MREEKIRKDRMMWLKEREQVEQSEGRCPWGRSGVQMKGEEISTMGT